MLRVHCPGPIVLTLTLLGLLLVPACDSEEASGDPASRAAANPPSTIILDIALPADASPAEVSAIARTAEVAAGPELSGAAIEAKQTDAAPMVLSVTVWGSELAEPDAIVRKLRADHPALADAAITVSTHAGAPADEPIEPIVGAEFDETPAEAKARIVEELRDKGVTGEISVEVVDEDQGRRVEVRVEDHE